MRKPRDNSKETGVSISTRGFITAILVILALMVLTYVITLVTPDAYISFGRWLASPILVLGAEGSGTLIAVLIFLLVVGAIFSALEYCGIMQYMLDKISFRYADTKYKLLTVIMFFFMGMGALIGSFEECVPLVPIVTALCIRLGWDALTGLGASLLAVGCGFASGVFNPFTVGVAQGLAGLPMFSGAWFRAVCFVPIFLLLLLFVRSHAKKVEKPVDSDVKAFVPEPKMDKALLLFALILGFGIALVLSSSIITALQDYTMIIVAVMFLVAGIVSSLASGCGGKKLGAWMWEGLVSMLPAVLMILMASSIKYTMDTAGVFEILLNAAVAKASNLPKFAVILFIYLIVLIMNFFIASGSAKAFMLIPLIVPLAEVFGISAQLCIVAYAFGDGFSNVFYPTNPALLISLGLADISYVDWAKWSWKFQFCNILLTSALLVLGLAIGY